VLQEVVSEAEAELGARLRAGDVPEPLTTTLQPIVRPYLLDVINFRLKTRGNRTATKDDEKLYDDAQQFWTLVADRKVKITSEGVVSAGAFRITSFPRVFDRGRMSGY
jgi:hypothetical protein